jgi:hypothetical protein
MRYALILLCLFALPSEAAVRRLTECGTLPATISEVSPFDLDACNLVAGDDIAVLLTDIETEWGAVYVRAPSKPLSVIHGGSTNWGSTVFLFLEDGSNLNTLSITHVPTSDVRTMWDFSDISTVKVGGPNLSMTFIGTHPGLGVGEDGQQDALLAFTQSGSSNGVLADIRANFYKTYKSGLYFSGPQSETSSTGDILQVNIAGVFTGSGFNVNGGVYDVWVDPDRTVVMDPWMRGVGWDGGVAGTYLGTPYGCSDLARYEYRNFPPAKTLFVHKITGGVTLQYGHAIADMFVNYQIGNGASDPFILRLKDWGFSGPIGLTGYPSGVLGKMVALRTGPIKHDPLWDHGTGLRHLRIVQLPSTYGNGTWTSGISSGCAVGNLTSNAGGTSAGYVWQPEASRDNSTSLQFVTAYVDVTFSGFTEWWGLGSTGTYALGAGESPDSSASEPTPDRSFGHTLRVASGTQMPGVVTMMDTTTITGPGSWYRPVITEWVTAPGGVTITPHDNTIINTRVHGYVTVGDNATNTLISNVEFTGSATALITVEGGDVTLENLCIAAGKQITGSGTVDYEGLDLGTLPYTFPSTLTECDITEDGVPNPVSGGSVD